MPHPTQARILAREAVSRVLFPWKLKCPISLVSSTDGFVLRGWDWPQRKLAALFRKTCFVPFKGCVTWGRGEGTLRRWEPSWNLVHGGGGRRAPVVDLQLESKPMPKQCTLEILG